VNTPLLRMIQVHPGAKLTQFGSNAIGLNAGEGEALNFRAEPYRMKLGAKQTNGQLMLMDGTVYPGEGIFLKSIHSYYEFYYKVHFCTFTDSKTKCSMCLRAQFSSISTTER